MSSTEFRVKEPKFRIGEKVILREPKDYTYTGQRIESFFDLTVTISSIHEGFHGAFHYYTIKELPGVSIHERLFEEIAMDPEPPEIDIEEDLLL
ncbi:MAG: hypothetical protein IJV14_10800 [Lachnospiraceae bacterium]|nr:hypothetical protein [Lachnospiraceae bacterium]